MGTASLSYPIAVPEGRQGMRPSVALTYNSNGGNGVCGVGWDLNIPCVTVETRWGVPLYSDSMETETYLLNGEQLLDDRSGTPTFARPYERRDAQAVHKRYYPRVEGAFDSIVRHGNAPSKYWWEVVDRDGTHYIYGDPYQRTEADQSGLVDQRYNIARWNLRYVIDRNGNTMEYHYRWDVSPCGESGLQSYLDRISYTLSDQVPDGENYLYEVRFHYTPSRPDPVVSGNLGLVEYTDKLLTAITTTYVKCQVETRGTSGAARGGVDTPREYTKEWKRTDSDIIRGYRLLYTTEGHPQQSRLRAVVEQDKTEWDSQSERISVEALLEEGSTYKYHLFDYYGMPDTLFGKAQELLIDTRGLDAGKPCLKASPLGSAKSGSGSIGGAAGAGVGGASWLRTLNLEGGASFSLKAHSDGTVMMADLNGDGYPDLLFHKSAARKLRGDNAQWRYSLFVPDPRNPDRGVYALPQSIVLQSGGFMSSTSGTRSANISLHLGVDSDNIALAANAGYQQTATSTETSVYCADVNGDGLADIVTPDAVYYNVTEGSRVAFSTELPSSGGDTVVCSTSYYSRAGSAQLDSGFLAGGYVSVTEIVQTTRRDTVLCDEEKPQDLSLCDTVQRLGFLVTYDTTALEGREPDPCRHSVVRVWEAPMGGEARIEYAMRLDPAYDDARAMLPADTVRLSLQRNGDTLSTATFLTTGAGGGAMADTISLQAGDRIYFRMEGGDSRLFDVAHGSPEVRYLGAPADSLDYEGRNIHRYNAAEDFHAWSAGDFVATGRDTLEVTAGYTVRGGFSDTVYLTVYDTVFTPGLPAGETERVRIVWSDTILPGVLAGHVEHTDTVRLDTARMLRIRAWSADEVDWTRLAWRPRVRSVGMENAPAYTVDVTDNGDTFESDTLCTVDHYLSPTYRTFYTYRPALPQSLSDMLVAEIYCPRRLLDGRRAVLVERTASRVLNRYAATMENPLNNRYSLSWRNGSATPDSGGAVQPPIRQFNAPGQTPNPRDSVYYEIYISGPRPSVGRDSLYIYRGVNLSRGSVGIKFDAAGPSPENNIDLSAFGTLNRGWGQFVYNTHRDSAFAPIDEAVLAEYGRQVTAVDSALVTNTGEPVNLDEEFLSTHLPGQKPVELMRAQVSGEGVVWASAGSLGYVGDTVMSLYPQGMAAGSDEAEEEARRESVAVPNTAAEAATGIVKTSRQRGTGISAGGNIRVLDMGVNTGDLSLNGNWSRGSNEVEREYMDFNGDGYPDIATMNAVAYTNSRGGLSEVVAGNAPLGQHLHSTEYNGQNLQGGGSFAHSWKHSVRARGAVSVAQKSNGASLSGSGSMGRTTDSVTYTWMDVNGDGLPDQVGGGRVALNMGYRYAVYDNTAYHRFRQADSSHSWSVGLTGSYNQEETLWRNLVDTIQNLQGVISDSVARIRDSVINAFQNMKNTKIRGINASFSLGLGLDYSDNVSHQYFADLNGDGLPDRVVADSCVYFNRGWRFDATPHVLAESDSLRLLSTTHNSTLSGSLTLGGTLGAWKLQGTGDGGHTWSTTNTEWTLSDLNGDGLPDLVSYRDGAILVRHNRTFKAGKLRRVQSFYGNVVRIDYAQAPRSDHARQRPTVMSRVETFDARDSASSVVLTFSYGDYCHNVAERTPYGFRWVNTTQWDGSARYRETRQTYHNDTYKFKGLKSSEAVADGQGRIYTEQSWYYRMKEIATGDVVDDGLAACFGPNYPALDSTCVRLCEPATRAQPRLVTAERFHHGPYGRMTRYINHNDISTAADDLVCEFTYTSRGNNQTALVSDFVVRAPGTPAPLRHRSAQYDARGNMTALTQHNGAETPTIRMSHDPFGNMERCETPSNTGTGTGHVFRYTYDPLLRQFPVRVEDSTFGTVSRTAYDTRLGVPTRQYSVTGDSVSYAYDGWARPLAIRAPKEADTLLKPTICYYYWDGTGQPPGSGHPTMRTHTGPEVRMGRYPGFARSASAETRPWAVTRHHSACDTSMNIATVLFSDGMGRVAQTRKTSVVNGQPCQVASGNVHYDRMGRVDVTQEPFVTNAALDQYVATNLNSGVSTYLFYDILDRKTSERVVSSLYPSGQTTTYAYGFEACDGYQCQRVTATDPMGNTAVTLTDARGLRLAVLDAMGGRTGFGYDRLGQLAYSVDPEGVPTFYQYDNLGRLVLRDHPDAGVTQFAYDFAGNMVQTTYATGDWVKYNYDFNRLLSVNYPRLPGNNVNYTYDAFGRVTEIQDGSGRQMLNYDEMGNVSENIRTFAIPNASNTYTFKMNFEYDSWNRMQRITYPDGEVVRYGYDEGGALHHVNGAKGAETFLYVKDITYNKFGQRHAVTYGNGTGSTYTYDALQRLSRLTSHDRQGNLMQDIHYTFDAVSNITQVANTASAIGTLGGQYTNTYQYDNLYRLTTATQSYGTGNNLVMKYSPNGRVTAKAQLATQQHSEFGYCPVRQPHAVRRIFNRQTMELSDLQWDANGNLAQVNTYNYPDLFEDSRYLFWTEDNRLSAVVDPKSFSYYGYDHTGERTLKFTGTNTLTDVNADFVSFFSVLSKATLYTSPYLVATERGYTKHYYAGAERICAKTGGGGLSAIHPLEGQDILLSNSADKVFQTIVEEMRNRDLYSNDPSCITGIDRHLSARLPQPAMKVDATVIPDLALFAQTLHNLTLPVNSENDRYFYHLDHLGSASWITDSAGKAIQHLQYCPYGEPFVDHHTGNHTERFTFTGKERDAETGYHYFGARYLDATLMTSWLAVDPMSDKYPSLSPYNYCALNSMKLVDPEGKDIEDNLDKWKYDLDNNRLYHISNDGGDKQQTVEFVRTINGKKSVTLKCNYNGDIKQMFEWNSKGIKALSIGNSIMAAGAGMEMFLSGVSIGVLSEGWLAEIGAPMAMAGGAMFGFALHDLSENIERRTGSYSSLDLIRDVCHIGLTTSTSMASSKYKGSAHGKLSSSASATLSFSVAVCIRYLITHPSVKRDSNGEIMCPK